MKNIKDYIQELEKDIQNAYESSPTLDEAERLAAKFLSAQVKVGSELASVDLDTRMKKTGLKAIKAGVYLAEVQKSEKKPSDTLLGALVDTNELVGKTQDAYDSAEVNRDELQNFLKVCHEAHVYFRGIAKGRFE